MNLNFLDGETSSRLVTWMVEGREAVDVVAVGRFVEVGLTERERLRLCVNVLELSVAGLDANSGQRIFHLFTNSALEETVEKCADSSVSFHLWYFKLRTIRPFSHLNYKRE